MGTITYTFKKIDTKGSNGTEDKTKDFMMMPPPPSGNAPMMPPPGN
jgi:hypothetical protein